MQSKKYTSPQDGIWNIPSASILAGFKQFPFPENWGVRIGEFFFPIVSGPYLGIQKSYFQAPILRLVRDFELANLIFNLSLLTALILICSLCIKYLYGNTISIASVSFIAILNGFIWSSAMDYGPFLVGCNSIFVAVVCALIWHRSGERKFAFISLFALGIAISDKLTSAPFVIPILILVISSILRYSVGDRFKVLSLGCVAFFIPLIPNLIYFLGNGISELKAWIGDDSGLTLINFSFNGLVSVAKDIAINIHGGFNPYLASTFYGNSVSKPNSLIMVFFSILLLMPPITILSIRILSFMKNRFDMIEKGLAFIPVVSLSLLSLTQYRPWHLQLFVPLLTFNFVLLLKVVRLFIDSRSERILKLLRRDINTRPLYFALVSLILLLFNYFSFHEAHLKSVGRNIASPAIRQVASLLSDKSFNNYICLDYSICRSIAAINTDKEHVISIDFTFDSTFSKDPLNTLRNLGSCQDAIITTEIDVKEGNLESDYLNFLTKNSQSFYKNNVQDFLNLNILASAKKADTRITVWQLPKDC